MHALLDQGLPCVREAYGRVSCSTSSGAILFADSIARGHRRHERRRRLDEPHLLERRPEAVRRSGDERAVERTRHAQLHGAAGAGLFGSGASLVDRGVLARDDDLPGAVVVRRPHVEDAAADALHDLVVEAEDRRHRARVLAGRLRHREPTLAHERDGLFDPERPGRRQRGELADRVADDKVRLDPARANGGAHREARRDESRLLDLRLDELRLRPLEAEMLQIEAGSRACALEDVASLGDGRRDLLAHPDLERPLAGEAERNQTGLHCVHSIRAEPHVSPAPMPVINTRSPSLSRPSACASARASGIEPEDVLP